MRFMTPMEPKERLDDILKRGLVINLFEAEQAFDLNRVIGAHADGINNSTFAGLFGSLQATLVREAVLSLSKLLEESKGHRTRSIPSAIGLLKKHASELPLVKRAIIIDKLIDFGHKKAELDNLADSAITEHIAREFDGQRPRAKKPYANELSSTWDAVKTRRDKAIAHNEVIRLTDLPGTTYAKITELLSFAKSFVQAIGTGYSRVTYEDASGDYMLPRDHQRTGVALKRLLAKAGIIPDR